MQQFGHFAWLGLVAALGLVSCAQAANNNNRNSATNTAYYDLYNRQSSYPAALSTRNPSYRSGPPPPPQSGLPPVQQYGPEKKASPCYDEFNRPTRCTPEFVNAAYNTPVEATNTCGLRGPAQYCVQTGASGSTKKTCETCDARTQSLAHLPEHMIDANDHNELSWWQSESLYEGKWPQQVNITLHLGKAFEITYVRLRFQSPRAESFAIYKRTREDGPWVPFQYYSSHCLETYNVTDRSFFSTISDEQQPLCTKEFSDISPLTGGNVVFTTLEGRPNANHFETNNKLQDFVTATDIRISLDNMNTFGDEIFGDEQVLRSYYYAISDLSVGGICKCNGHANRCDHIQGDAARRMVCRCEHNTTGVDCEKCLPFYNDQPWKRATVKNAYACQPCNCNGKSNKCRFDEGLWRMTGHGGYCLDCADNTDGPNCERCKPNYYHDSELNRCTACDCDPIGSVNLQCNGNGQCSCKSGVEGKRCDRCAGNYFDFSHTGCRPCGCNIAGSANNVATCDKTGKCLCKKNIEGDKCDKCKPGFFDLEWSNELGCVPCFCFGHSSVCTSSPGYSVLRLESTFNRDAERWVARDSQGNPVSLNFNTFARNIGATSGHLDNPIYFHAPDKYLGDKKYAYNRNISFSLQINGDNPMTTMKDIIIEGNGIQISLPIFAQGNPIPTTHKSYYSFKLNEDLSYGWGPQLDTKDFISLLSNVTAIKIRTTYTPSGTGMLDDFGLEAAVQSQGEYERASWVETCTCPEGYEGQHCESCAAGYKHDPPRGGKFARCVPCECNKHGEYCDADSGRCICNDNTAGDTCDRCAPGFYGNALNGSTADCHECPCPAQGECTILPDETVACLHCPEGYGGLLCDQCVDGYALRDAKCEKCKCSSNIDVNAIGNCDVYSGRCLKCIYNTWGDNCERCLPGYYGSALALPKGDCRSCACNSFGTMLDENQFDYEQAKRAGYLRMVVSNFSCDAVSGQCRCKPNVGGRQCNACLDGYWDITSNKGCQACNCDLIGSVNRSCDDRTGQCNCRPGVTGKHCNQCLPDYYGFSDEGCKKCDCDPIGTLSTQCDLTTGQCQCRPNVEGRRCEYCMENKYNKEAGCIDCPPCYTLVQEAVSSHRIKVNELKNLLDEIEQSPLAVQDTNFEKQLSEMINTVSRLLEEAKELQGIDGSLIFQLEQIKTRIRKVQETTKKINGQLDFIGVNINYGVTNISIANDIANSAENDLNNARNYLENDGRRSLEKARLRAKKYGERSNRMTEIARESRLLADTHERNAETIINKFKDARNISEVAHTLAKDAILTQKSNKEKLDELRKTLSEVKDQYQMTQKLSEDVHKDATKAEQDSLALISEVGNVKIPEFDSARLKAEAISIIDEAKRASKDAGEILDNHKDLLAKSGDRLSSAKELFQDAERQQEIADRLLSEVDLAYNETKEAIKKGENILEDAKNTLKTLKEFDQNVQASKGKADEALGRVPGIEKDINEAIGKTEDAKNALKSALTDAMYAKDIAKAAEEKAVYASNESKKIKGEATLTKLKVSDLDGRTQALGGEIDKTASKMSEAEKRASEDEKLVQNALELANTAKTSAQDAIQKVKNATDTVNGILRNLNGMDDMDENQLKNLEQRLLDANNDYKASNLDDRVDKLRKMDEDQKKWIHSYEEEVRKLAADVANIAKIREALPDGCFRRLRLEP